MRPEIVNPQTLGAPRGYSHGVLAPAGSRLLAVAGQIGWDGSMRLVSEEFSEQFRQALANVLAVVTEAGGVAEHVLQLTIFVTDKKEYLSSLGPVGAGYRETMGSHYPAMALVEVSALVDRGAKVEIQALAALPGDSPKSRPESNSGETSP